MYCPKCHKAMDPELPSCTYCGFLNREYDYNKDRTIDVDYSNTGLNILGLIIPIIGILLFLINRTKKPNMSNSILKYSIGGLVIYLIIFIILKFVVKL